METTIINLSANSGPAYPKITLNKSGGWIGFGDKNQFPQDILDCNSKSPVNSSIIESTVTYICGKGIRDSQANADKYVGVPNHLESWDDLIERLAKDYKTFGGFYLQIILNNGGTTVSLFHQDFSQVRIGEISETGKPLTFRISKDWTKTSGKDKPLEIPVWPGSMSNAKKGVAYLFHYWDYTPGLNYYCLPGYYPALEYVKADGTLGQFYNNSINNGFTPSVVINMPSNPSEEKKAEFQKQMERAFSGAKGASSIVILWGESDEVKPGIAPFNASANADIYNNVEGIVFQKIVSAHRLASPTLAGVSGSGNLSGNAAEIIDAYVLYNYTVVEKMRRKILDKLNIFTAINGTGELIIEELDVLPKIRESGDETKTEEPATLTKKNKFLEAIKRIWKRH
jgi:Phage portal protein.